jgi:hypothetical protein
MDRRAGTAFPIGCASLSGSVQLKALFLRTNGTGTEWRGERACLGDAAYSNSGHW